ncbi:molybdopterin cofactor-binding domain-containing protein [Fusobacterium sp.]|uniref:xanthine dehydrogenase family protein molybdopterin-binding subunit n=1 Tax=Fusobacterium sp. TaxID=68766 RepID=UPI00262440F7|nr:molybdopterin cofactor-binding domain-containing protein [Fusobacterium sp.]
MKIVNNPTPKVDSINLITGKPVYTDDLVLNNNTLTIKLLRSPYAYAKIKSIDKKMALLVPGVEAIYTFEDVPKTRFTPAGQSYPEPSPYDRRLLDEYVRYVGDPVAIIAAESEKIALKAMKLIKVEYEVLEPLLDYEKATTSPVKVHMEDAHTNYDIGYDRNRNIASHLLYTKGNVEAGLSSSEVVIERTYRTQAQIQSMMETYRSYSFYDVNGRLTTISSTQIPFHVRRHLSRILNLDASRIRVIKPRIGGGFGAKQTMVCEMYSAFVTMMTKKPSKIIFTRKEAQVCGNTRHAMTLNVKIGSDKEGNIKGIDIKVISNTGAYGEHAPTVTGLVSFKTFPLYEKIPMRMEADVVYTNTMVGAAFRGYGATQGTFAVESIVNELADTLNISPIEIRMKNLVEPGKDSGIASGSIKKCIEIGKEKFNWDDRYPRKVMPNGKIRGYGMAVTMQGSGIAGVDTGSAMVRLNDAGNFTVCVGVTDMGQGSDTVATMMAAEVLEVPMSEIIINASDTDVSPYDPGAYASSGTYVTGKAVVLACEKMKKEIVKTAATILETTEDNLIYYGSHVESIDKTKSITIKDLALKSVSFDLRNQLATSATWGSETSPPPFVAGFAEVEIDPSTGKCEVLDILSVVDCGTPINPSAARVQVEGGMAQGIGLALYEDIIFDKKGRVMTDSFMQYKIPCRKDIHKMEVEFSRSYEETGPFGAKSIGEVVINTPSPAIAAAIKNAVGVNFRELPITSEDILIGILNK